MGIQQHSGKKTNDRLMLRMDRSHLIFAARHAAANKDSILLI